MAFYADLHIHSKYSRATSKHCDLEHLALWGRKKGITVIGSGDFTHPAWLAELKDKLLPAEPGLFRLRPDLASAVSRRLPHACHGTTRFLLSVEISTIYKKGERTRKIHHLIYVPDFDTAERVNHSLGKIGNLNADGRPILGLDSRHLLEIVLQAGAGAYLVPAHIWTPWFAALGSKSGFDAIDDCYADLAPYIFAVETGLSSDPPMNWQVSSLDRFRLVSNSDAHSPEKLGREACVFDTDLDYFAIRRALETGQGYEGTVEFFPEEGKYHLDGHRTCHVRFSPPETRAAGGACPVCGKPVTVGVMHRVEELADRPELILPTTAGSVQSLVPLPEVLAEIVQTGARSKTVMRLYDRLIGQLGPELALLNAVPLEDIRKATSSLLAEAISRLRQQQVIREAGFDGEYGTIRLFHDHELRQHMGSASLFPETAPAPLTVDEAEAERLSVQAELRALRHLDTSPSSQVPALAVSTAPHEVASPGADLLSGLDEDQRHAVTTEARTLLIVAGPGSGKTRTLTHRIAYLISQHNVPAPHCLTVTFTRRAADAMRTRLQTLLPDVGAQVPIFTFHALGLAILQEHWNAAGLQRGFRVASEAERVQRLQEALDVSERQARRLLKAIARVKRTRVTPEESRIAQALETYEQQLTLHNWVDYDDLVGRAAEVLTAYPDLRALYRQRYPWVFIDEYQDVDEQQVRLLKQLVLPQGHLCAIGDPDQAIYGFRGADVGFFEHFDVDFLEPQIVQLRRNYRSDPHIVTAALQVMAVSRPQPPRLVVRQSEPRQIIVHEAPSEKAEAEFVVQTIEHILGGHSFFSLDSGRGAQHAGKNVSFADFAVLYRTEAQRPALIEALQRSGMPFQQRSHQLLMAHPGVPVLLSTMLNSPVAGSVRARLEAAVAHHDHTAEVSPGSLREAIDLVQPVALACGEDIERFIAELAVGAQVDTWDERADRIALLTLHAAKGLEFPVIFMVGCEAGMLPLTWGRTKDTDRDEERRLFYVGMTRAQTGLYLCHARTRLWRGRVRTMSPSPFVTDIEERLLARQHTQLPRSKRRQALPQLELF